MNIRARWLASSAAALACCLGTLPNASRAEPPEDLVREYTEDIRINRQLMARGLATETDLAMSYQHRGETYHLYLNQSKNAIADLTKAVSLYRQALKQRRGQRAERLARSQLARTLLFCSRARLKDKDWKSAEQDASGAIKEFQLAVAGGAESFEPPLAWAHQTRAEIAQQAGEHRERAIRDLDAAIEILRKWSTRQESLAKKLPKLQALRRELADQ